MHSQCVQGTPDPRVQHLFICLVFNLLVGLFGLIAFDPFYKTNNTQTEPNHHPHPRLVRFATLQISSMHVSLPLMHEETCIISIAISDWPVFLFKTYNYIIIIECVRIQ